MPVSPRRDFTCLTVALTAFMSPLLPTLRPQLHEVRPARLTIIGSAGSECVLWITLILTLRPDPATLSPVSYVCQTCAKHGAAYSWIVRLQLMYRCSRILT